MSEKEFTGRAFELNEALVKKNGRTEKEQILLLKDLKKNFFRQVVVTGIDTGKLRRVVMSKMIINAKFNPNVSECGNFFFAQKINLLSPQGKILKTIKRIPPESTRRKNDSFLTQGF
jgi:hypothetical protein